MDRVSLRKEMSAVIREAERQGWRAELGRGGHWKLYAPDGRTIVTAASTPGTRSTVDKTVALMRKCGFIWKGR